MFRCPDGALGGGMKRNPEILPDVSDSFPGHFNDGHILYDNCVSSSFLYLKHLSVGSLELIVVKDRIQGHEYSGPESSGMIA